jgi:hypothetical protein
MPQEKIDWKKEYKDFPEIPSPKQWNNEGITQEQIITNKLIHDEDISLEERSALQECINFYKILIPKLRSLIISKLDENEIKQFLLYYDYVFNYITCHSNDLYIPRLYRLVDNESVLHKREKIRYQKFLSYPPKSLVKKQNIYNRANTPDFNLFYATDSIDNSLLEIKPANGKLVTVGVWIPKQGNEVKLISYPISHNPYIAKINPNVRKGYFAFQTLKKRKDPLLSDFMEVMFSFISEEFAKPIKNPRDYFLSARFSESIFQLEKRTNPDFNYDCIIYPSLENRFQVENVAIRPDIIDSKFKLEKVIDFEIVSTHYDRVPPRNSQEEITVAKIKNRDETDWIENDGYIVW